MKQNKYKITVYAICKNEENFVDKWVKNMSEADEIVVLDTGSTDKTVQKLKQHGVKVIQKVISPWRFDHARNESLKLVSRDTDICVCTDLDELFNDGWRDILEKKWAKNTNQAHYKYVWNVLDDGRDGLTFYYEKIHSLKNFKWIYPVHEILSCNLKQKNCVMIDDIILRHYPDPKKNRGQYLPLLELSIKEYPNSDRNMHYLAREYMFHAKYDLAIKTFKKHLKMKTATWKEERSASLRYIGDCYYYQNKFHLAKKYYEFAIIECCYIREPYLSLAKMYFEKNDFLNAIFVLEKMLEIKTKSLCYMTQCECWNEYPFDLLSICYFNIGDKKNALSNALLAQQLKPDDKRISNNVEFFKRF